MSINKLGGMQIIISSICFGALPLLTKISYQGGANVITILAMRFCFASILIWAYLFLTKTAIKVNLKQLIIFAFVAVFSYGVMSVSYFTSLHYIPSSTAAMIMFIYPVLTTFFSAFLLKSPITKKKVIALLVVTSGALIMTWGRVEFNSLGILLALISALSYALYIVYLGSRFTFNQEPKVLTAFIILFAAIFFTLFGVISGEVSEELIISLSGSAWWAIILMAIFSTVFSIMVFYAGVKKIGSAFGAILSTAEPVTAVFLGLVVLGEKMSILQWVGSFLIIVGIVYVQIPGRKPKIDWKTRV